MLTGGISAVAQGAPAPPPNGGRVQNQPIPMTPRQLKELYREQGINISSELRQDRLGKLQAESVIEISYDLQAGTYIALMQDQVRRQAKQEHNAEIVRTILSFGTPDSIMEAGVGEATTLSGVLQGLGQPGPPAYGFDLSWSRLAYARRWLHQQGLLEVSLCTGSLLNIPFADDSVDVVYTASSIEPNGGHEEAILKELFRVTARLLVLLEPCYELGNETVRRRMDSFGYCKNLKGVAEGLGYRVIDQRPWPVLTLRELNPLAVCVIEKRSERRRSNHTFACPTFKTPLEKIGQAYFSNEGLVAYPILDGIPCLRAENAIVASAYPDLVGP